MHTASLPDPEQLTELLLQLTPIADIAALHHCNEMELREEIARPESPLYTAARHAKAALAQRMRVQLIERAESGDPTAAHQLQKLLARMYNDI